VSRRLAIDTNLYIDALRTEAGASSLSALMAKRTAFIVMSAVVAQELRAGARTKEAAERLEEDVIGPFVRRRRLIVPSFWAWKESGRILSSLVPRGEWASLPRSFVNDTLLAMSCREAGVVLVTNNLRDCERIAKVRKFEFVGPG
jgi:predicted nucleic acid-binding protein